ncbi:MAG: TetR/AcrR family transcriptional regulator [Parvibaculaceae bacterium]|nr:TetR/AcrR family transcriptional regulator [Parvibaculaceae bacterium]
MDLQTYRRSIAELKQNSILASAREIFLARGYSRSGMADIARQADVSTATLYKHFPSKENLFQAVVNTCYETPPQADSALHAGISGGADPHGLLQQAIEACIGHEADPAHTALQRMVIAEVQTAPQLAYDIYANDSQYRVEHLKKTIDELVAHNHLRPHDTELSSRLLLGMIREMMVWPQLFGLEAAADPEEVGEILSAFTARYGTATTRAIPSLPDEA